ncbi:HAD family hydrolase, partial [Streptomyces sp. NPDC059082]|uniref:HAD family hydrolase n=1 Tax=Streptomyces sp. NPDC059082 TaxID=3346720 RepID=UPI003695325B
MDRAALFDVDGTLVDTNHLHVVAWWEAFRQGGHRVATHAVHRALGLPGEQLIDQLLAPSRDRSQDAGRSAAHATPDAPPHERRAAGLRYTSDAAD